MRFNTKKQTKIIRDILVKYLDGTEVEFGQATSEIIVLLKSEFDSNQLLRQQLNNTLIAADTSDYLF